MSNLTKNLLYNWLKVHFLAVQSFFFFLILFIYCWLLWAFVALVSGVVALQLLIAVSSHWRAWAHSKQAQELWHTCSVVPRQVESSQTRDQSHVPCIGRWILNHWTTGKVLWFFLEWFIKWNFSCTYTTFWRRQWHPAPALLPGKSHGWRSLVGCSPWGR